MYEPVLIGEYTSGLQTNRKPFMINKEAWAELENAWNFRGRIRKKYGYKLKGRLRIAWPDFFVEVSPSGNRNYNLKTLLSIPANGTIEPGSVVFTDGTTTWTDNGLGVLSGGAGGTINYNTGVVVLNGTAAADVFAAVSYFPNLPVMGLRTRERVAVNNEQTIAFDTDFSYRFVGGQWECLPNTFTITNITTGGVAPDPEVTTAVAHNLTTGDIVTISGVTGDATMQAEVNNKSFVITVTGATTFTLTGYTTTGTYTGGGAVDACELWTGTDSQFFWTTNFEQPGTTKLFWAVNFNGQNFSDPLRYYDGTIWQDFTPNLNGAGTRTLSTAAIIEPYKERLLVFKTREIDNGTPIIFPQRIRWSEIGDPTDATNGWRDDIEGRGGFLDVPIAEAIITVGFIRDRIIIYCERSTWELIYTGNELDPFKLRKINTELGAESRFSRVLFDSSTMAVGNVGIHSCNGDSVVRIDDQIPSFVFDIHNGEAGVERVYGIRDYYNEIVMWTYPDSQSNPTYPNRLVVFNYRDNNWAIWKDCYTCFGYFQRGDDRTWASYTQTTWETAFFQWQSGQSQSRFREIVAGNQNGYVFTFFPEETRVVPSRYITNVTKTGNQVTLTIPNHCLEVGDYISVSNVLSDNNQYYDPLGTGMEQGTPVDGAIQAVAQTPSSSPDDVIILTGNATSLPNYAMGGEVTKYDNINMRTKFFTPFWKTGASMQLNHIDFLFDRTRSGEVSYNIYVDDNTAISMTDPAQRAILGTNVVRTAPDDDDNLGFAKNSTWHRAYGWADGQTIQVQLTMNDEQMKNKLINQSDVVLYAMVLYVQRIDDLV